MFCSARFSSLLPPWTCRHKNGGSERSKTNTPRGRAMRGKMDNLELWNLAGERDKHAEKRRHDRVDAHATVVRSNLQSDPATQQRRKGQSLTPPPHTHTHTPNPHTDPLLGRNAPPSPGPRQGGVWWRRSSQWACSTCERAHHRAPVGTRGCTARGVASAAARQQEQSGCPLHMLHGPDNDEKTREKMREEEDQRKEKRR
jgi:hypothetical protein